MRFRLYGIALGVFFALGLVFSFGVDAFAGHGDGTGIKAEDVDPKNPDHMKEFLTHIINYYNQQYDMHPQGSTEQSEAITVYGRSIRQDGPYKHGEVYSMGINERRFVTNHANSPNLLGYELKEDASGDVAETLNKLISGSSIEMPACEKYGEKYACAQNVRSPSGSVTVIAGIHHDGDGPFTPPNCDSFKLTTKTAKQVYESPTDENLRAYVKGVIGIVQDQVAEATRDVYGNPANTELVRQAQELNQMAIFELGQKISQNIYEKIACFSAGDLKYENIYAFVMDANPARYTVLVNGNNFDLNGTNLNLDDDQLPGEDKSITGLFTRALESENPAFVNYHWDDPKNEDDNVDNFFEDGKVPGTSCKRSYIETANINEKVQIENYPPVPYIFGSGIYVDAAECAAEMAEVADDDDGCAIAGAGHTPQGALLNLLLTASVLFSVVFLRRRV